MIIGGKYRVETANRIIVAIPSIYIKIYIIHKSDIQGEDTNKAKKKPRAEVDKLVIINEIQVTLKKTAQYERWWQHSPHGPSAPRTPTRKKR